MSRNNDRSPGPVPPRWLHCPRKAHDLVANKFLAFKTPLSSRYDDQVPEECRFPPEMIFELMKSYKVKIGLWIDLTNTSRFYNKDDVEEYGCKYLKLQCRGHGETPSEEQTKAFIRICSHFISHHPLEIIGVHCTHGFNRTGFLLVSYMVENMDCSVDAAVREFARVRPPGIYKHDYLLELFKKYEDISDTPAPPELPDWCQEEEEADDDDGAGGGGGGGEAEENGKAAGSNQRRKKEFRKKNPTFMEGVSGVTPVTVQPKLSEIQKKTQSLCGWRGSGFPGSQPVSMDTANIQLLHQKPYRVSWKADGTRYMMLILQANEVYFIDRDNAVFQVSGLKFPHRKDPNRHIGNTLLDGEMVIDKVNGKDIPRYLAYDIIKFEGNDIASRPFYPDRLTCIDVEIVQPRNKAFAEGRLNKAAEPFSIRLKQFWDVTQSKSLLSDKFSKNLAHEPDGLIFQPAKEPYVAGRCMEVLKWKPLSHNSVDFKLKILTESGAGILPRKVGQLFVSGLDRPFASIKINKTLKEFDNKIIECRFQDNQWVFMRERTDKSFANSFDTAKAVCNSIRDPVTSEKLLDFIEHRRFGVNDQDLMPPPSKVMRR